MSALRIRTRLVWPQSNNGNSWCSFESQITDAKTQKLHDYVEYIKNNLSFLIVDDAKIVKAKATGARNTQYETVKFVPHITIEALLCFCFDSHTSKKNSQTVNEIYKIDILIFPSLYSKTNPIISDMFINKVPLLTKHKHARVTPTSSHNCKYQEIDKLLERYINAANEFERDTNTQSIGTGKRKHHNGTGKRKRHKHRSRRGKNSFKSIQISQTQHNHYYLVLRKILCVLYIISAQINFNNWYNNKISQKKCFVQS